VRNGDSQISLLPKSLELNAAAQKVNNGGIMSTRNKNKKFAYLYALKSILSYFISLGKGKYPKKPDNSAKKLLLCLQCNSVLGVECGDAEPDFSDEFCSIGCVNNHILQLRKKIAILRSQVKHQKKLYSELYFQSIEPFRLN